MEIVQLLIEQGADFRRRDNEGLTAAQIAASNGHDAVAKWLLSLSC